MFDENYIHVYSVHCTLCIYILDLIVAVMEPKAELLESSTVKSKQTKIKTLQNAHRGLLLGGEKHTVYVNNKSPYSTVITQWFHFHTTVVQQ